MEKLQVSEMGPICEAEVELKPLTVFAGASNTGKSYLSTMIYAILSTGEKFSYSVTEKLMSGVNNEQPHKSDLKDLRSIIRWMKEAVALSKEGSIRHPLEIPAEICRIFKKNR